MSYTPKYSKPYPNGWKDSPSKETPVMAENLNAYDNVLLAIEQYLSSEIGEDYAKLTDAGYSLGLDIDHSTYVMTISLKNKAGEVISSKSIDFPIESMVVDASYSEGILTLSLQNGTTLDVDISAIVGGLVADTRKIAGLDLKDDITAEELRNALSVPTKTSELENDSQYITADDIIPEDSVVAKGEIKPWLYDTSGQETIVGVYNQKPLYQKVLFFENVTVGNEMYLNIDLGMGDNIDKIFVHNVHLEDDVGILYDLPFTHPHAENTIGAFLSENGNTLNLRLGSSNYNLTFRLLTIILRYTKTTDAEGSGEELMPYGFVNKNIERLDAVEEQLSDKVLPQYKKFTLPTSGWYRIAKFDGDNAGQINSSLSNGCDIDIKKLFSSTPTESHFIRYRANSSSFSIFLDEVSSGMAFDITKIRVTSDNTLFDSYIEVYYNASSANDLILTLSNQQAIYPIKWETIEPVVTSETVNGVSVIAIHEFSQNKSYESEIEAINSRHIKTSITATTGATGNIALGYSVSEYVVESAYVDTNLCIPFVSSRNWFIKVLSEEMQPLSSTSVTYTVTLRKLS